MAATKEFQINFLGIGGTLLRFVVIVVNTFIIIWGTRLITMSLPYFLLSSALLACIIVYRTQKHVWDMDIDERARGIIR
jgi:hypothetical protein